MTLDPFLLIHSTSDPGQDFEPVKPPTGTAMARWRSRSGRYLMIAALALLAVGLIAWTFRSLPAATGDEKIANADIHQLCIDIKAEDNYSASGAWAQQWNCTGVREQQFLRTSVGNLYEVPDLYTIRAERSNICLDEVNPVSACTGQPTDGPVVL